MTATRTPRTWSLIETEGRIVATAGDGAQVAAIKLRDQWLVVATEADADQPWFSEWFTRGLARREVRYLTTRRMRYPPD
jgi:hypothetical protein